MYANKHGSRVHSLELVWMLLLSGGDVLFGHRSVSSGHCDWALYALVGIVCEKHRLRLRIISIGLYGPRTGKDKG